MKEERIATVGMFDGVHLGHRFLLDFLKSRSGERPIVFTFPFHPLSVINPTAAPKLITSSDEKKSLLALNGCDCVLLDFDENLRRMSASGFLSFIKQSFGVSHLVLGYNNRFGCDRNLSLDDYMKLAASHEMKLSVAPEFVCPDDRKISSSIIRKLIFEGDVDIAGQMIGRPYQLTGKVVHGRRIGHHLGFPTANISDFPVEKIIPESGVYVADVQIEDNSIHRSVVNIGLNPTVGTLASPSIEAHLINFDGDLYGQTVTVKFLKRIRDEKKFESVDKLVAQIADDCLLAQNFR